MIVSKHQCGISEMLYYYLVAALASSCMLNRLVQLPTSGYIPSIYPFSWWSFLQRDAGILNSSYSESKSFSWGLTHLSKIHRFAHFINGEFSHNLLLGGVGEQCASRKIAIFIIEENIALELCPRAPRLYSSPRKIATERKFMVQQRVIEAQGLNFCISIWTLHARNWTHYKN